jgi:hypothetical protein
LASQDGPAIMACMPATKTPRATSSDDLNAAIERVAPDVLALLADGVPRTEPAIIAALARRHSGMDIRLTLMRLDVLGRLEMRGSRYTLPAAEAEQG